MNRAVAWMLLGDVVAPIAAYYILRSIGLSEVLALSGGGAVSALRVLVSSLRRRRIDVVAGIVTCTFGLAVLASAVVGSARILLAAESIPTVVLGVGFLASLLAGRPIAFPLVSEVLSAGDPGKGTFWRQAWDDGPTFRPAIRTLTAGWGILLLVEGVVRLVLVPVLPIDAMVGVSRAMQLLLVLAMLGFAGWYARRTGLGIRPYLDSLSAEPGD